MSEVRGTYHNDHLELGVNGKRYIVQVDAECSYIHEPCVMYYKDGTGDPGCDEFEIEGWEAQWFDQGGIPVPETSEMAEALGEYLYDKVQWEEWDWPPEPECPELEDCYEGL